VSRDPLRGKDKQDLKRPKQANRARGASGIHIASSHLPEKFCFVCAQGSYCDTLTPWHSPTLPREPTLFPHSPLVIFLVVAAHNIPGEPLQRALILDVFAQFIDKSDAVSLAIVIGRLAWCLEAMEGRFEAVVRPKHELVAHVTDYHMVDVDATMGEIWTYDKHFSASGSPSPTSPHAQTWWTPLAQDLSQDLTVRLFWNSKAKKSQSACVPARCCTSPVRSGTCGVSK
jgi:hypothetical protein